MPTDDSKQSKKTKKTKPVTFFSKFREFRLIKEPSVKQMVGNQFIWSKSVFAQFVNGQYTTDDPGMLDWLRNHHGYGQTFFEEQEDMEASENPEPAQAANEPEEPPVVKPKKSGKKATTAADVDAEAAAEGE
jgi:hypothetical protein